MYFQIGRAFPYAPATDVPFLFDDAGDSAQTATDGRAQQQLVHLMDVGTPGAPPPSEVTES